jgi:sugar lactone lactonase YvrE
MNVSTLYAAQCTLGEGPIWHQRRGSYFWVDIEHGILHEFSKATGSVQKWPVGRYVSAVIEQPDDSLILGVQGGLVKFDMKDGNISPLVAIDADIPANRCNDGACDSEGRIWIGTMNVYVHDKKHAGSLYRVDTHLEVTQMLTGLPIPNGIVWSVDGTRMYFIETISASVKSYLFDKATGDIQFEKIVYIVLKGFGLPDGMCINAEGMLWIALYGGSSVQRINPATGEELIKIELPAPHITNCCFGGDELDEMVITSARENLSPEQLAQYPESGNTFIVTGLGIKGLPGNRSGRISEYLSS